MDFLAFAEKFGLPVTMLLVAFVAGARRVWVWGYQLVEMTTDRNFYRDKFFVTTTKTERDLDELIASLRKMLRSTSGARRGEEP